ncbi:MAG TPA: hypothetical protein VFW33_04015 [Gemmataceae bacterium]|nr:hypothetical protein [Gemmataceae bacterium]
MTGERPELRRMRIGTTEVELIPADTTLDAWRVQVEIYRRMPPSRRLELACEMSDTLRRTVAAGVRGRHPDYSEEQVRLAVARLWLGDELFRKVYPGVEIAV